MNGRPTRMATNCGRMLTIGRFQIPAAPTTQRIVLRIDPDGDSCDTVWTSLTSDEAVTLAHALLAQARTVQSR